MQKNGKWGIQNNYLAYVQSLAEENRYLKEALETSESLIKTYQLDNNTLKLENQILKKQIEQIKQETKLQNASKQSKGEKQDQGNKSPQQELCFNDLKQQIERLVHRQTSYEDKIRNLESHIFLLQRKDKMEGKNNIALNISLDEDNDLGLVTFNKRGNMNMNGKTKNLSELRALHMKLQSKDQIDSDTTQTKSIVSRVFSSSRINTDASLITPSKRKKHKEVTSTSSSFRKKY